MNFPSMNMLQNNMYLTEKLGQINMMLQNNYSAISRLESRINNLMELNEKIKKELDGDKVVAKSVTMLENSPPEEKLIEKIFLKKDFSYYLVLTMPLKMPLYKDRNFNLQLGLFDKDHKPIANNNSIPLQIALYTASQKPELIDFNKQGNPIFKGNTSVDLANGSATFYKLSIREVTSKFERGVANIVVYVKSPPLDKDNNIDYRSIRPFIIKDVQIRAKKV